MEGAGEAARAALPGPAGAAPPGGQASAAGRAGRDRGGRLPGGLVAALDRPLTSYYLILGITTLLIALGLVMVLSTSSAQQLDAGGSPYASFQHQLFGVAIGIGCMWLAARASPAMFRAVAYPLMFLAVLGLLVTPLIGTASGGAIRELQIGPLPFQPSELAKLAFLLWGADLLARKEKLGQLEDPRHLLIPLLPGTGILGLLVMFGDDLGTTFLLLVIFLALLWVIGTPLRMYLGMLGLILLVLLILVVVARYRFARLTTFFNQQGGPT